MSDVIPNDAANRNQLFPLQADIGKVAPALCLLVWGYQCPQCGELIQLSASAWAYLGEILALYSASPSNPPQLGQYDRKQQGHKVSLAGCLKSYWSINKSEGMATCATIVGINVPQFLRDIARGRISIASKDMEYAEGDPSKRLGSAGVILWRFKEFFHNWSRTLRSPDCSRW